MKQKKQHPAATVLVAFMLWFLGTMIGTAAPGEKPDFKPVANEMIGSSGITWAPKMNYAQLVVTVNRPDGTVFSKTFAAGSTPYLDLSGIYGEGMVDGLYSYELTAVQAQERGVRKSPETAGFVKEHRMNREPVVQTGYFSVREGMIITSGANEAGINKPHDNLSRAMDQVIYDDLIVDGSLCVGNDCYSGLAFGFDTIVLMENNLRIYFDDTSNTSSFPNNDWRIVINDTTDGGGAYFALQDVSGGLTPFTIEAGAKSNSLYVDDDGQVGIGTSTPVFELHIREGDTPTVRLHQSTAYGWPEQIWDVGGNETSFFIRDGTHAAKLPFRIEPETPSSTLCLKSDGKVGIGTWSPGYTVEVETTGENAGLYLDRTDGATFKLNVTDSLAQIGTVSNNKVNFVVNNSAVMTLDTNGWMGISDTTPDYPLDMGTVGNNARCTTGGVWQDGSSRASKENINDLTLDKAMEALGGLNPVTFNYKVDKSEQYVGFIAEDVPELVATNDRKTLSPMDIVAVLTKVVQEQQKSLQEQQEILREQQETISQLKEKIMEFEKK
jgi:hypothetical protein